MCVCMPEHRHTQKSASGNVENAFAISEAACSSYRIIDEISGKAQLAKAENMQVLLCVQMFFQRFLVWTYKQSVFHVLNRIINRFYYYFHIPENLKSVTEGQASDSYSVKSCWL